MCFDEGCICVVTSQVGIWWVFGALQSFCATGALHLLARSLSLLAFAPEAVDSQSTHSLPHLPRPTADI